MDARDEPRHGCPVRNEGDIMETSAISAASMAPQLSQQATAAKAGEAAKAQPAQQQQAPKTEPPRPVSNMQGQRTGTLVNTTA
jgi:hypothetical protein